MPRSRCAFPTARPLVTGGWVNPVRTFVAAVVTHNAPQASNSSSHTSCLGQRLFARGISLSLLNLEFLVFLLHCTSNSLPLCSHNSQNFTVTCYSTVVSLLGGSLILSSLHLKEAMSSLVPRVWPLQSSSSPAKVLGPAHITTSSPV